MRRVREDGGFRLTCLPGRVVLDLDGPPPVRAEVSVARPDEPWVGTALVRIAHVKRLGLSATGPADPERMSPETPSTSAAPARPVTAASSEMRGDRRVTRSETDGPAAQADRVPAGPMLRVGLTRLGGLWAPRVEAAGRWGRGEQGLTVVAAWNGTTLGVVRGQLVAWTLGWSLSPSAVSRAGLELIPRLGVGAVRMAGVPSEASTTDGVVLGPVAEAGLDGWWHAGSAAPLGLGLRLEARAGPTGTAGGRDVLTWSGLTASVLLAWERR
jgi:hypothetical protein